MIFVLALLLAIFVLPSPWSAVVVGVGAVWELAQISGAIWWSQRRRARVGAEALVGVTARVVTRCAPRGRVAVRGEIWNARCETGVEVGESVRVLGVQGLTLDVERAPAATSAPASHQST